MDWLTFFSSIIESLAWPVVILTALFIFKNPFCSILSGLLFRVSKIKFGDTEAEFNQNLTSAEKEVSKIDGKKTFPDQIHTIETKAIELISTPVIAVIFVWTQIESEINRILQNEPDYNKQSTDQKLMLLYLHNLINRGVLNVLQVLKRGKDYIIEAPPDNKKIEAQQFISLGIKIISILKEIQPMKPFTPVAFPKIPTIESTNPEQVKN